MAAIHSSKAYYRTYSVAANSFATEFMTFESYHAILQVNHLTRVKENGDFEIVIEYINGLQAAIPQTSSAAARPYYSIPVTAPSYNVKIYNKKKEVVLDKNYGGTQSIIDFGKGMYSTEEELKSAWNQQGTDFLQRTEFQSLKFEYLRQEFMVIADKLEDAAPFIGSQEEPGIDNAVEDIFADSQEEMEDKAFNTGAKDIFADSQKEMEDKAFNTGAKDIFADSQKEMEDKAFNTGAEDIFADSQEEIEDKALNTNVEDIFETSQEEMEETNLSSQRTFENIPTEEEFENTISEETPLTLEEKFDIAKVTKRNKNIVKLNLLPLGIKNISLNYERILADRRTASLTVNTFIPGTTPSFLSSLVSSESPDTDDFSGFSVTGDYRFYGNQKGAPKGFYYAPFARYANYKYSFDTTIENNLSNANTALTTYGVGIQIGTQWVIKDRFVIDWGILGVSIQQYNVTSTFTSIEDINFGEIQESIESNIEDNGLFRTAIEFNSGDDFLQANLPFLFGGLRSYLSVGIQF